ncbi:MAG: hypothetical protein JW940_04010 [Polyangiaceae bacterium]|nr:hypothetical protein [Polyangiaceae bacterium]
MRSERWLVATLAAAALGLFGCNLGGQTGTEATPPATRNEQPGGERSADDHALGAQCDSESSLVDADDAEALGFSAEDVLAIAKGAHEASLAWRDPASFEAFGATGTFGPEEKDSRITLTITHTDGEVRLVQFTPKQQPDAGDNGTTDITMDSVCPPARLEIDVWVRLETRGGALDESFMAVLAASGPFVATLNHSLAREDIDGSFAVELSDAPPGEKITVGPVDVQASFYAGGMAGTLFSFIELQSEQVSSRSAFEYAHWPADDPCVQSLLTPAGVGGLPVSVEASFDGVTAAAVLTELETLSGVPVTWSDSSETQASLAVSAPAGTACLLTGDASPAPDGAALLRIPVDIVLETEDGRVDAALAGTVDVASTAQSDPVTLSMAATQLCDSDDAAAECGWPDVDADGYDALRVDLSLETTEPASASTISGTLTLAGITVSDCTDEPVPVPDDDVGGASPGCAGEQQTEIESGAIGAP